MYFNTFRTTPLNSPPRALPIFPLDQFIFGQLRPHPTPPRSVHPPKFDFVFSSHQLLVDLAAPRRELNSLALLNWLLTVSANSILIGSGQSVAGDRRTTAGFHHFCCTFCKAVSSWKETFNYIDYNWTQELVAELYIKAALILLLAKS